MVGADKFGAEMVQHTSKISASSDGI